MYAYAIIYVLFSLAKRKAKRMKNMSLDDSMPAVCARICKEGREGRRRRMRTSHGNCGCGAPAPCPIPCHLKPVPLFPFPLAPLFRSRLYIGTSISTSQQV